MGRKSTKENKNIYQISRENAELTRDAAAEQLEFISSDRIEKIENNNELQKQLIKWLLCHLKNWLSWVKTVIDM